MKLFSRALATVCALLLLFALPLNASAGHVTKAKKACPAKSKSGTVHRRASSASGSIFNFGIQGGNMNPWSVSFDNSGAVTSTGWIQPKNKHLIDATSTLDGLMTLANSTGFYTMPTRTNCPGVLPDIVAKFIVINSNTGSTRVEVHGNCVAGFNRLYGALENTADFQH